MGTITRNFANNLTTSGLLKPTAFNNDSFDNVTSVPNGSVETGDMVFIKKLTASSSATLSFVDGTDGVVLDDTYKEYIFYFVNIHSITNNNYFTFNMSTDGGSNYNVTKTSTKFWSTQYEAGGGTALVYRDNFDMAQGTGFLAIAEEMGGTSGGDADANLSGYFHLFNPSSDTFVKHFISRTANVRGDELCSDNYVAGYGNTTSPVNAIKFQLNSGNFNGQILLFGVN